MASKDLNCDVICNVKGDHSDIIVPILERNRTSQQVGQCRPKIAQVGATGAKEQTIIAWGTGLPSAISSPDVSCCAPSQQPLQVQLMDGMGSM